jgi:hypothetical protein
MAAADLKPVLFTYGPSLQVKLERQRQFLFFMMGDEEQLPEKTVELTPAAADRVMARFADLVQLPESATLSLDLAGSWPEILVEVALVADSPLGSLADPDGMTFADVEVLDDPDAVRWGAAGLDIAAVAGWIRPRLVRYISSFPETPTREELLELTRAHLDVVIRKGDATVETLTREGVFQTGYYGGELGGMATSTAAVLRGPASNGWGSAPSRATKGTLGASVCWPTAGCCRQATCWGGCSPALSTRPWAWTTRAS